MFERQWVQRACSQGASGEPRRRLPLLLAYPPLHVESEFPSRGESPAGWAAVGPLSWIWERRCPSLCCRGSSAARVHAHGHPRPFSPCCLPAGWGQVSFLGCRPSPTPGYPSNCAVNWRSLCVIPSVHRVPTWPASWSKGRNVFSALPLKVVGGSLFYS